MRLRHCGVILVAYYNGRRSRRLDLRPYWRILERDVFLNIDVFLYLNGDGAMKTMQVKGLLFFVLAYGVLASAGCGGGDSEEQGVSGPT